MLELVGVFFGRKMECVGARISGGAHVGPMRQGRAQGGRARPPSSWLTSASPWGVLSA